MTDREKIGREVRRERLQRGWTQDEVASRAGVSQALIVKIESGKSVREALLEQVAAALGRSVSLTLDPAADTGAAQPRAVVRVAEQLPEELDAVAERWLRVLPKLPLRYRSILVEEIALWERKFSDPRE